MQPHPQRGTSTIKKNHRLLEYIKAPQTQQYKQDGKAEKYQQVKEHDKCLPTQTEEEEIRKLHDREFRIMVAKMIHKS